MSGPQFSGGASAAAKKKFLEGPKQKQLARQKLKEKIDDSTNQTNQKKLEGPFKIINPIDTCIGPIGQFIMEPDSFPLHPSVLFYGKRRTGKSYSCRWILYKCFSDYPFGICCTGKFSLPTLHLTVLTFLLGTYYNGFWQKYIPGNLVFQGLDETALSTLIKRQIAMITEWRKKHPNAGPDDYKLDPALRAFVVLGK